MSIIEYKVEYPNVILVPPTILIVKNIPKTPITLRVNFILKIDLAVFTNSLKHKTYTINTGIENREPKIKNNIPTPIASFKLLCCNIKSKTNMQREDSVIVKNQCLRG